ncbi:MAG: flagellar hook-length control protein FliK [Lachnospiraceae bacterium]|nr:flagellar hook-length control protein FliK [Lachnospiraceae bacterium]
MANLGGITQYQNQLSTGQGLANGVVSAGVHHGANAVVSDAANAVSQELMQLGKGSMFTGTVTQMKDGNVTVSLDNGQTVHARLDSGVSVTQGQPVLFQVKSNQNNQLMLRQVPVESAYNPTLQKALAAAGLMVNERNLQMVNAMMQNQLPINKNSLLTMARQLQMFPGAGPESLAQMKKLGFPITETMVQQFEAYKQGNHSLVERFSQMMNQLPELLSQGEGSSQELLALNKGLLQALEILEEPALPEAPGQGTAGEQQAVGVPGQAVPGTGEGLAGQDGRVTAALLDGQLLPGAEASAGQEGKVTAVLDGQLLSGAEASAGQEGKVVAAVLDGQLLSGAEASAGQDGKAAAQVQEGQLMPGLEHTGEAAAQEGQPGVNSQGGQLPSGAALVSAFMGQEALESLESQLRQLPGMEQDPALFSGGKLNTSQSAQELLKAIAGQLEKQPFLEGEKLKSLLSGKGYQRLLRQAMSEQWLMEPRQVEQEKAVEQLYERLNRQMGKLEQLLQQAGKQDGAAARNTTQVRGNLEMMQQINQLYNYVQLPLKLRGQNAHSDLYVYTNKKSLRDKEGELSALLHLELDNLGVTDVRIKMLGSHVTTHFCMSDEAALDLVEAHLEELDAALARKGYQCSFQTEQRQQEIDFVEDFLEQGAPIGKLQRYSFDVLT